MSPRLNLTSLSESVFKSLFRLLFRYDIFISYARRDGKEYAIKLRDQLKQLDFSCFLDFDELPAGNSLNKTLKRAISKSATLVIVGTDRAVKSRYVELEVEEFGKTGRAIIPIDIEGTLVETPWAVIKERDIVWIDEVRAALTRGVPSPTVADSIDKLFKYTRRNSRVRAQVLSTIILFVVVVAASILLIRQQISAATRASAEAERQTIEARTQETAAKEASIEASKQKRAAEAATANSLIAERKADESQKKASIAEKAAGDATREAKKQETLALANAAKAKAEQARAEERTRYVLAQQTAVQSDISRQSNDDPDRNVLLSVESLKRALTPEGYVSWERGMDLLPHPFERQFESIKHDISSIAYSPDGKLLAEGARDGTVIVQRTNQTGRALELQPKFTNAVSTITFGSDGSWFAAASQTEIKTWDTKFLKVIREGRMDNGPCCPQRVAFSPDGRYAAMGDPSMGPRVRVIDLVNSSTVVQAQLESVSYVMGVSFSPNGKWLAISCHENGKGKVILWDVSRFAKRIEGSPDSIASVTDSELIGAIVFSPKGNYLATPLFNGNIIWSIAYDEGVPKFSKLDSSKEMKEAGRSLVFSPDEKLIASVTNKDTIVWDVQTGREITRIRSAPFADIAFTPDSRLLTTASQDVRIWKLEFGSDAWRIPLHDESSEEKLTALAVSPGGEWLATGNTNGVSVFRTNDWSRIVNLRQAGNVSKLTFDSLGRWLISASDKEVNAFDTKQWKGVKVISLDADISFSPDGRWLVVTSGLDLKLFEYDTWREVLTMKHSDPVNKVFFSPDGGWLGVQSLGRYRWWSHHGYDDRKRTYIWDTSNGSPVACRTDTDISDRIEKESDTKDNRRLVCPEIKSNPQSALLAEVATWKATLQFNQRTVTRDGLWSGEYVDGIQLRLKEGIGARYVATFPSGPSTKDFTFTPDNRWIVVASDKYFTIWPLKPADMIEVACGRLRRRDLSADEWKRYFSGEKVEPTCASKQR